jgi:hypothetical protein
MRDFGPVIRIDLIEVLDSRHHRPMSGIIALQFVGHEPSWFTTLAFEETAKEAFRRCFVASALDKNIYSVAVLVFGPPLMLAFPLNGDKDFVEVPGIAKSSLSLFEFACIVRPKIPTPLTNRGDASFGKEFFHLTEAQTESMVQPHGVTDNVRGKRVALVAGCLLFHTAQFDKLRLT